LPKSLLIIYYSNTGRTEKIASQIARGADMVGVNAILKRVEDCTLNDLAEADGIAIGSPTYYSNIAWQIKRFMDETILAFYTNGHSLKNKVCGCFTSTGACNDGKECLRMLELAFGVALKMKIVPGIIVESKDVDDGNLSSFYEYGQKIARELNSLTQNTLIS
jgi:NAD(P)H dehydrogenase (quinone)